MMKKMKITKRRGSTLVLALVLTMVLFIMGIAFISTTSIQRDMVENVGQEQSVNDGVDEVVAKIKLELKKDLFESEIDNNRSNDGEYSGFLQGIASYDYPDENNKWLASLLPEYGEGDINGDFTADLPYYYFPQSSDLWDSFTKNWVKGHKDASGTTVLYSGYLDFHYDPDPLYRRGKLSENPLWWDFSYPGSWLFKVENNRLICRIVDREEIIEKTYLNEWASAGGSNPFNQITEQWNNISSPTDPYGISSWLVTSYPVSGYRQWVADELGIDAGASPLLYKGLPLYFPDRYEVENDYDSTLPASLEMRPGSFPADSYNGMRADADGDGVADSRWVRLGRVGTDADYIYAAVRIIDNCGMINLNTAFRKPGQSSNPLSSAYDGTYVDDNSTELDNWDGSSVSHINSYDIVRSTEANCDNIYIDVNTFSFPGLTYAQDFAFAVNKSACPYTTVRRMFDWTSGGSIYDLAIPGSKFSYSKLDLSEELELRNRFFLDTYNSTRVKNAWPVTLSSGGGYGRHLPYYSLDTNGDAIEDYYQKYWSWFGKAGMLMTGNPASDILSSGADYFSRRTIATVFNKDRLVRPDYDITSNTTVKEYKEENTKDNIEDIYNLDDVVTGNRRCSLNLNATIDLAGAISYLDQDSNGLEDRFLDRDKDDAAEDYDGYTGNDEVDLVTNYNLASAFYMALQSYKDAEGVNEEIRKHYGEYGTWSSATPPVYTSNPLDYNSERLSLQFMVNYLDYFDNANGATEAETVIEVKNDNASKRLQYKYDGSDRNHRELYFGVESLSRIEDEVLNISSVAYLKVTNNDYAGPGQLTKDIDENGVVPQGNYLAIELFNPSLVYEKRAASDDHSSSPKNMDLRNYTLLILNGDNEVKSAIPFDSFSTSTGPYLGTLPTIDIANSSTNTMVVVLFDLTLTGVTGTAASDLLYDTSPGQYDNGSGTMVDLDPTEYAYSSNAYDRVANTFGTSGTRMVYVDVTGQGILNSAGTGNYITKEYSIALVKEPSSSGTVTISDQIDVAGYTGVYPCDIVSLDSCEDSFQSYRDISSLPGAYPFNDDADFDEDSLRGMYENINTDGDDILRVCYRRDVFGNTFDSSNDFVGSYLLLPASAKNAKDTTSERFNPWYFGYRDITTTATVSDPEPPKIGVAIAVPNKNNTDPLGTYEPLVVGSSNTNQLNVVFNTVDVFNTIEDDPTDWSDWSVLNSDQQDYYTQMVADKAAGYAKVKGFMAGNFDLRQLYDRYSAGNKDKYWISGLGELQDVFAIGARCVEVNYDSTGAEVDKYPSDAATPFPVTGSNSNDRVYYQPFMNAFMDSVVLGVDNRFYAASGTEMVGNPGRINLGDELYSRLPEFVTVIDYTRDGIDNDGLLYTSDNPGNDGYDNDGDGTADDADGSEETGEFYEREIAGRININTAPWYVLARLPWVTEELAQAIVAYRDKQSLDTPVNPGGTAFKVVDYNYGRSQGMWDSVHTAAGEYEAAPFDVREDAGFKSVGELYNVTHGLRMEFPTSLSGIGASFSGNEDGSYLETILTSIANNLGLAIGATYDNRFDIRRWGRTMGIFSETTIANSKFRLDFQKANSNDYSLPLTAAQRAAIPFYDDDLASPKIANDDIEKQAIFNKISNLVTTRSDVFTAYILVRVGEDGPQRRMIGIFDRSGVYSGDDEVRLVALYQVPEAE